MNVQRLNSALVAHLPSQPATHGVSAGQLANACEKHSIDTTSTHPYPPSMSSSEQAAWSRDLGLLARQAQSDFGARGVLGAGQLQGSLQSLARSSEANAKSAQQELSGVKRAYWGQVAKTGGWMAGTLLSLGMTGVAPSPITLGLTLVATSMCVRSIGRARSAAKELSTQAPQLKTAIEAARQVARDASQCAPLVGDWAAVLQPPDSQNRAA